MRCVPSQPYSARIAEVGNIAHLAQLQFLDLSNNQIVALDEKKLPHQSLSIVNLRLSP
jgi:hypothetical protein